MKKNWFNPFMGGSGYMHQFFSFYSLPYITSLTSTHPKFACERVKINNKGMFIMHGLYSLRAPEANKINYKYPFLIGLMYKYIPK
jgi:hypothetical protein